MRILALEVEKADATAADFQPYLAREANAVWELYQAAVIREAYFRRDQKSAVLILECADVSEAEQKLGQLPLVAAGLIGFDLIPLVPYSGFSQALRQVSSWSPA